MKLLAIVDDDDKVRTFIERVARSDFSHVPLQVFSYGSGSEALLAIQRGEKWDGAIVDLYLRDVSGTQVVRALRNSNPGMKIYVLTGQPLSSGIYDDAKAAGADEIVAKGMGAEFYSLTRIVLTGVLGETPKGDSD